MNKPLTIGICSPLALLRDRSVAGLFAAHLVSCSSIGFGQLALAWGTMREGYGAGGLSLVLASNAFPALLMICGGVIGDRFRRHQVLAGADALTCASWLAIGATLAAHGTSLPLLCTLAAVGGTATALYLPTLPGLVADLLTSRDRPAGNALINQTQSVGLLIGLVSSGVVVSTIGPAWAATARGLLCAISAFLLSRLTTGRSKRIATGPLRDLRDGWRHFGERPWVWIMTLQYTAIITAVACYTEVAGPLYMADGHGDARAWGIIRAGEPLGALLGALLGARWRPAHTILTAAALPAAVSLPMLAMGGGASWQVIAISATVPGVTQAIYYVLWTTALQDSFPPEALVRVTSWNMVSSYALMPLIMLTAGPLTNLVGAQHLSTGAGLLVLTATIATLIVLGAGPRVGLSFQRSPAS
ncbi:MFS transporter [Actinomadura verrucosospora]|uniref:MFS transporter n=1 Tax=Actinomadura verrucosospora TaxID=46165 RepID=UPI001562ECF4|nr:MFS transporter [Actinomadura verrucosospora]